MTDLSPETAAAFAAQTQAVNAQRNYPMPVSQDRGFAQWLLNLQEMMQILEHNIRGDMIDYNATPGTNPWIIAGSNGHEDVIPNLNELGISVVMGHINARTSKMAPMTQYTDDEIKDILLDLADDITNALFMGEQKYALKDHNTMEIIVSYATSFVGDVYNAAKNGRLGDLFSTIHHESSSEIITKGSQPNTQPAKRWGVF